MRHSLEQVSGAIHPHARLVARRWHLPLARLAYLEDPDEIEAYAEILVRRRERSRRAGLRVYWSLFYGGTGLLLAAGLLVNVALIAIAALWLVILVAAGLMLLHPDE